jgi:hypothetical protein
MEAPIMLFAQTQRMNKHQTTRTNSKKSLAPACLGLAFIFLTAVLLSGCVVNPGHGRGYQQGHGRHKAKIRVHPEAEIRVSPYIVIDD